MDYNTFLSQLLQLYGGILFLGVVIQLSFFALGCWVIYMFYARLRDIAQELMKFRIAYEFAQEARSTPRHDPSSTSARLEASSASNPFAKGEAQPYMIPVGTIHYCTVDGAKPHEELCERCGRKFVYQLHRTATGERVNLLWMDKKGATEEAAREAMGLLQKRLAHEFDIVSCPSCGHIQKRMVKLLWKYAAKFFAAILFFLSLPSIVLVAYSIDETHFFTGQLHIALLLFVGAMLITFTAAFLAWRNPRLIYWMLCGRRTGANHH